MSMNSWGTPRPWAASTAAIISSPTVEPNISAVRVWKRARSATVIEGYLPSRSFCRMYRYRSSSSSIQTRSGRLCSTSISTRWRSWKTWPTPTRVIIGANNGGGV